MLIAILRYMGSVHVDVGGDALVLLDHPENAVAAAAIRAVSESSGHGLLLLEKLRDDFYPDDLKPEIILALGRTAYQEAYDDLADIVGDAGRPKIWRMYAADSLGRLGNEDAVPLLRDLFVENDALLRAYAASALSRFEVDGVVELLEQGLRDNNWRVRVTAIQALGERGERSSVPILVYKAKKDPAGRVRLEAIRALGEIGGNEAFEALRDLYSSAAQSRDVRDTSLQVLLDKDLGGSLRAIEDVVAREWELPAGSGSMIEVTAARASRVDSASVRDLLVRFLESPSPQVRVHALRGLARVGVAGERDRVAQMAESDPAPGVRREAQALLER
jgi:HEAT repeat protein